MNILYLPNVIVCYFVVFDFSFKVAISLHTWASKYICSIRYDANLQFQFGRPGNICRKDNITAEVAGRLRGLTPLAVLRS